MAKALTRKQFEEELNEMGIPEGDKKSNNGFIPDAAKYGSWLRRHDPIAFNCAYHDSNYGRGW